MRKALFISVAVITALGMTLGIIPSQAAMTAYVDTNVSFSQGDLKNGNPVPAARSNPAEALGPEDSNFVSLGYGGEIVLAFPTYVGGELMITTFERTMGTYPAETADVYVSSDGTNFIKVGVADNLTNQPSDTPHPSVFDLGDSCIKWVKLVDTTDGASHSATSDGFDIDAVKAEFEEDCTPDEECEEGDDRVMNCNQARVINEIEVKADTGENYADGSYGGHGGDGGKIDNQGEGDVEGSTTGNGGNGAAASTGGTVMTGDATATASISNMVNMNRTIIDRCACNGEDCDSGNTCVRNRNQADLSNSGEVKAETGDNEAEGSYGGNGGKGGQIANQDDGDVEDSTTGTGGVGAPSAAGGLVQTGDSTSRLDIMNVVNRTLTRILR